MKVTDILVMALMVLAVGAIAAISGAISYAWGFDDGKSYTFQCATENLIKGETSPWVHFANCVYPSIESSSTPKPWPTPT